MNGNALRRKIVEMVYHAKEGHIPSSFSIVDILDVLYGHVLRYQLGNEDWSERDQFVLSKGHGSAGLYAVMYKYGLLQEHHIKQYSTSKGILGGHPDRVRVPHVEASTGSLGHGFPMAVGIALGTLIKQRSGRVFALLGDGECHEGTIWESAHVSVNRRLHNLCAIVDWNGSAAQLMPSDHLPDKWRAFGWQVIEVDGHDRGALVSVFDTLDFSPDQPPKVIIAHTVKGKGVPFVEGHGRWHHRIPDEQELALIFEALQ